MVAEAFTTLLFVVLVILILRMQAGGDYRVLHDATDSQRRTHVWIQIAAAILGAAPAAWVVLTHPADGASAEFVVRTAWLASAVPILLLWLSTSGLIDMLWTGKVLGGWMPQRSSKQSSKQSPRRASPRLEAKAGQFAERLAAKNPRVPLLAFAVLGLLPLFAQVAIEDRTVRATESGISVDGLFVLDGHEIPWDRVAKLRVTRDPDRGPEAVSPWILTWEGKDGSELLAIGPKDLWQTSDAAVLAVIAYHEKHGIEVVR